MGEKEATDRALDNYIPEPMSGCWIWMGVTGHRGYGRVKVGGRFIRAHRFFYEHYVGKIGDDLVLRHRCDNPYCVNPHHLIPGTHIDNMRDMRERGRAHRWKGTRAGDKNPRAKLQNHDLKRVREMLAAGVTQQRIAEQFGVDRSLGTGATATGRLGVRGQPR